MQFNPGYYNYLYYSAGYARASFYNNNLAGGEASGTGTSNHIGLGLNFIKQDEEHL